jgi:hypothetical protein
MVVLAHTWLVEGAMRWRWIGLGATLLCGCDPAPSGFGSDQNTLADVRILDAAADANARDAIADAAPIDLTPDSAPDRAVPDMEPLQDMRMDAAPDGLVDAQMLDAAADARVMDAALDAHETDAALDASGAPDAGEPDGGALDAANPDGPFCGDQRRLPLDGVLTRAGPPDRADYAGCGAAQAAWSAFIELPEPRRVVLKTLDGSVQRAADCDGGVDMCLTGPQTYHLPAGRTDFIIVGTDAVRVRSTPACSDGLDNDGDGRADLDDPGCTHVADWTEADPPAIAPACSNGRDDDGDGRADWPFDDRCRRPGSAVEACAEAPVNTITVSAPGTIDLTRLGGRPAALDCAPPADTIEVLLLAPWGGRLTVQVDAVGAQAIEVRRGCDAVVDCNARAEGELTVRAGELVRVRIQGRPQWLVWRISTPRKCANGLDDDDDGQIDLMDPGCRHAEDDDEVDPAMPPVCSDGIDQDRDRARDFPEDFACAGPGGSTEVESCVAIPFSEAASVESQRARSFAAGSCGGADRAERRMAVHFDRPTRIRIATGTAYLRADCARPDSEVGCVAAGGVFDPIQGEATLYLEGDAALDEPAFVPLRRCANGIDDDGDGQIDLNDRGCSDPLDDDERDGPVPAACSDGIDNDEDGDVDWPADEECLGAGDQNEAPRCLETPDVGPLERLVLQGGTDALPVTHSLADGRPVRVALLPFRLDRPGQRAFPPVPGVNWVELRDCQPQPSAGFGEALVLAGDDELTVRMEVDLEANPFIQVGALIPDCRNGLDDDGDGLVDGDDPGCARQVGTERDAPEPPACADGLDNDGDGATDAEDTECLGAADTSEGGVCVSDQVERVVTESTTRWVSPQRGATRFGLPCGPPTMERSVVVPIEIVEPMRLVARTVQGSGDPVLSVEQTCDVALACADDGVDLQASVERALAPGRYALRVGRWQADDAHPIQVNISLQPIE